jgi:hypothetical protein
MANNAESLSRHVPWTQLLPHLGLTYESTSLPAMVDCPLCKNGKLRVYRDFQLNSEWLYCHTCRFAGDTIEFAAAVWNVEVVEAVERLRRDEVLPHDISEEAIDLYLDQIIGQRERLRGFENNSTDRIARDKTGGLHSLLRHFKIERFVSEPRWQEQGAKLVWGANCREVEDLFHPGSYEVRDRSNRNGKSSVRRGSGPGSRRLFKGEGWGDVLIVPYYDLPGRVCSLLIIGRDANQENGDVLFKPLNIGGSRRDKRESGVSSLLNLIGKPHKDFGDTLFVIADPLVALWLQLRHLRRNSDPLPIVGSVLDERFSTEHVFDQLPTRRMIFWGPKRDHQLFRQAVTADGAVSPRVITPKQMRCQSGGMPSKIVLNELAKDAVPWPDALSDELTSLDDFDAQNLLSGLRLTPAEQERISRHDDFDVGSRIDRLNLHAVRRRRAFMNNRAIIETAETWCFEDSGEEVCNGTVRVERLVRTDAGRTYYSGWAQVHGTDFRTPFVLDSERVHKHGLLPVVRDTLLADAKSEQPLIFKSSVAKDSLNIALQFCEQVSEHGTDRVGWHDESCCFAFPQFSLGLHGEATNQATIIDIGQPVPAADWERPFSDQLDKDSIQMLSESAADVALLWAMAACVAEQLLSSVLFEERHPVVIEGSSATAGFAAAEALGCLRCPGKSRPTKMTADDIVDACEKHSLPALMPIRSWSEAEIDAVCSRRTDSVIINGNRHAVRSLGTQGRWHVIHSRERVHYIRPEVVNAAQQLMPLYLRHVLQQSPPLTSSYRGETFIQRIFRDMAGWLEEVAFNSAVIQRAETLLTPAGSHHPLEHFMELLQKFVRSGDLSLTSEPVPVTGSSMNLHIDRPNGRLWIPKDCVSQVLSDKNAPPIDTQAVTADMRDCHALSGEHETDEVSGWFVAIDDFWSTISPQLQEAEVLATATS